MAGGLRAVERIRPYCVPQRRAGILQFEITLQEEELMSTGL